MHANGSVSEQTYERLRSMILSKQLPPEHVLEERTLSLRLKVSRTPTRMALSRLLGEGMIARLSNGSLVVREIGMEDYFELIQLRRLLEGEAAYLAAGRVPQDRLRALRKRIEAMAAQGTPRSSQHWALDDDLHGMIAEACGNRWIAQSIQDVRRRVRMCNVERQPRRFHDTCAEHLAILDALAEENAEAARQRMQTHIDQVRQGFISLLNTR